MFLTLNRDELKKINGGAVIYSEDDNQTEVPPEDVQHKAIFDLEIEGVSVA